MTHCQIQGFYSNNTLPLTRGQIQIKVFSSRRRKQRTLYSFTAAIDLLAPFPWKQRAEQEREKLLEGNRGLCCELLFFLKIKPTRCLHSLRADPALLSEEAKWQQDRWQGAPANLRAPRQPGEPELATEHTHCQSQKRERAVQ